MSGEAIKIGIRVRPFNADELASKQILCIGMVTTYLGLTIVCVE